MVGKERINKNFIYLHYFCSNIILYVFYLIIMYIKLKDIL